MKRLILLLIVVMISYPCFAQSRTIDDVPIGVSEKNVLTFARGYKNGYPIFTIKYHGTIYSNDGLEKLSHLLTGVKSDAQGIFTESANVTIKYGSSTNTFEFNAIDFLSDTQGKILTELKARFIAIRQWIKSLNNIETFEIEI